jgi:hypothetical protein
MTVSAEHQEILAEWDRLQAEPPPRNLRAVGCLTVIAAVALFFALPFLAKLTGLGTSGAFRTGAFWVLVIAFLAGLFFALFTGSGVHGRARVRAEESLEWLATHAGSDADPAERRRHAVTLLYSHAVHDGPTLSTTFDAREAAQRLGGSLAYVLEVEQVLVSERALAPVFSQGAPG